MSANTEIAAEEALPPPVGSGLAFAVGFFFAFRSVIALVSVRVFGTEPRTGAEVTLALTLCLLGLVCFDSLGSAERTVGSVLRLSSVRWVLVFLAFSCCSLAWSETVSLSTSAAYWGGMAADVVIAVLLLRTGPATGVAHSLMKGFIWSACCLALIAWIMPAQSDLRLGDKDFFNTNQIGNLCALAIFLAQYLMRREGGKWGAASLFLLVTLVRSVSKTTIVAFLVCESFLLLQDRSISRKTKVILTTVVIVTIFVFWGLFETYYDNYTTGGNQAETLTGRTAIWAYVVNEGVEKPWFGHGFDSMWKVVPPFGSDQFEARHAEDEVLQQFYAYGAVGVVMLVGLYGSLFMKIRRLQQKPLKMIFLTIMIYTVVRGLAEAEPFDLLLPLWMIVMFSMVMECAETAGEAMAVVVPSALVDPSPQGSPVLQ
jgi:exopolysaccharide production protein ExoQ